MSEKIMLTDAELEEQAVMMLPDRTLLQQTNTVAIAAVIAQTSLNQCFDCFQTNDNVIVFEA